MRYCRVIAVLLAPLVLSGCLFMAGAAAEKAASRPDDEVIEYLREHDPPDVVARAMERDQIIEGMTKGQVEVMRGEPKEVVERDRQTLWMWGPVSRRTTVYFEGGEVVQVR
jgi:hypothetical protein